jgi:hypothetical protein
MCSFRSRSHRTAMAINETFEIPGIEGYPRTTPSSSSTVGVQRCIKRMPGTTTESVVWDGSSPDALMPGSAPAGTYFYVLELGNGIGTPHRLHPACTMMVDCDSYDVLRSATSASNFDQPPSRIRCTANTCSTRWPSTRLMPEVPMCSPSWPFRSHQWVGFEGAPATQTFLHTHR